MNMSLQVEWIKTNPINPHGYDKTPAQRLKKETFKNLKEAYLVERLTLKEYLIVIAIFERSDM